MSESTSAEVHSAPGIVARTSPFRLVYRDSLDAWTASLDEINRLTYDYVKLCRLSFSLDVGLKPPLCMHFAYDGSLILPRIPDFWPIEKAVSTFNQLLGEMLLGGVYFDAVEPTDIDQAIVYTNGYFRTAGLAQSLNGTLHFALQNQRGGPMQSIVLYEPQNIMVHNLIDARSRGSEITKAVPMLSVEILLHGVSAFVSHDWVGALSHLWIIIEQSISQLWERHVLAKVNVSSDLIEGRSKFLGDHRTWVASARIELLFQLNLVPSGTYKLLNIARKARNDLSHRGVKPNQESAESAYDAAFQLVGIAAEVGDHHSFVERMTRYKKLSPIERHYSAPRKLEDIDKLDGKGCWLQLPPIPGDKEWGDKPFESVYKDC